MTTPQSENPGAVSILQRGDESNHLANGLGSDGSELCSVTLITLSHITKSTDHLQTSRTDIGVTVGNVRKCRKTSILWTWNVQKSQLCFHLTHCEVQASFFATVVRNEINLQSKSTVQNKCVQAAFSSMCARFFSRVHQGAVVRCFDTLISDNREFSYKLKRWQVDRRGQSPVLHARATVDWLMLGSDFRTYDGILQDIFDQKVSMAWHPASTK